MPKPHHSGENRFQWAFWGLLTLFTVIRLCYIQWGPLDLAPDEAHYWEWSRHLDISYYSKGPMVAYIIFLMTSLGEDSVFFIRLGAVLISAILSIILYRFAKDLFKSERVGFFSALLPQLTLLFSAGSILMTIDPPFLLFWGLTVSCFYRGLRFNKIYWYLAGVSFGLGFLTKYSMLLFLPLALAFLLWHPKYRFWLRRKEPYIALALGAIVCYPVFLWNARHEWVSFRHVSGQTGIGQGFHLSLTSLLEFLGSQAGVISPLLFAGLIFALYQSSYLGFSKRKEEHLFLSLTSMPILIFFLLLSLHTKVQANWAAPAYFTGFISVAVIFDERYQALKAKGRGRTLKSFIVLALLIAAVPTALAYDTKILYWMGFPPHWDPTLRLKGWKQLGEKVSASLEEMAGSGKTFIFSNRYQISSELAFYVRGKPATYCVNLGRRFNQYDLWPGFLSLAGQDALYVKQGSRRRAEPEVKKAFREVRRDPRFVIYQDGEKIRTYSIFRCFGYRGVEIKRPKGTY